MRRLLCQNLLLPFLLFSSLNFQVIFSSPFNSSSPSAKLCSAEQSFALLHFKDSFTINVSASSFCEDYSYDPKTDSWEEGSDCCSWDGVTCDSFTGQVIELDLASSGLVGSISDNSSLFLLHHLHKLKLACNNFSKQFPDVFGNLSKLTHLDLSFNNFSGQLPSSAFNLRQLSFLDFSSNQLEGRIPHQVSGLSLLTYLHIPDNFVNGKVPSWLFTLPSLKSLDLSNNKLTGSIEEFHQAVGSLEIIHLGNNKIHGQIPNSMFDLLYLTKLDLSSNNLSGIVKSDMLSNLKNLNYIDLSHNPLLSLITNKADFVLPNLQIFNFSSCNITEFPIFLRTQKNLMYLDLSNNRIPGDISQLELPYDLYYLNVSYNFLTSAVLSGEISMINLNVLDLRYNLLQGPIPLIGAFSMEILLLSNNNLTGEIPSDICNMSSISIIDMSNNSLSGTIPQCLGNLYSLSFLNLQKNNFHGNIVDLFSPALVFILRSLEVVHLGSPIHVLDGATKWNRPMKI